MESPGDEDTVEQRRAKLGRRAESPGSSPVLPALPDRRCLSCNGSVKLYCDTLLKIIMCSRDEVTLRKETDLRPAKRTEPGERVSGAGSCRLPGTSGCGCRGEHGVPHEICASDK